jgi:hypothetical protein
MSQMMLVSPALSAGLYWLKTEVYDRHKLEADPEILTSLR